MFEQYGSILRRLRKDRELRLLDLARLVELDVSYLSRIETGDRPVPARRIRDAILSALQPSHAEVEALQAAAAQASMQSFEIRSDQGAIVILPGKDIIKLLKALKLMPSLRILEGGSEM